MADPKDLPDYHNSAYNEMAPAWSIVRDVSGGTQRMRAAGKTYLPQEPREPEKNYGRRLSRSVFFNAYRKTRSSLTGLVFQKDPVVSEGTPDLIIQQLSNVDLAGTDFDVFAKEVFEDAFEGHSFILVDMPPSLPTGSTLADERAAGNRPYWVRYRASDAVNWRTSKIAGEEHLVQITFRECATEADGVYGEKEVVKYRVFKRDLAGVTWELWKEIIDSAGQKSYVGDGHGTLSINRIPVAIVYGKRLGLMKSEPPLLDLAYLNIRHWQEYSDLCHILHIAQVPMLKRMGANPQQQEVEIGMNSTIDVETGGDVAWIEIEGKGISAARQELVDLEQRMAVLGLSILSQKSDTQITATEKSQDYEEQLSELATMARSLKDALELALQFHAEYLNLDLGQGGSVELGVAAHDLTLTPQHLQVLLQAVQSNDFSLESWLTVVLGLLAQTGLLPDDIDVQSEAAKVKEAQSAAQATVLPSLAQKALTGAPPTVANLFGAKSKVA